MRCRHANRHRRGRCSGRHTASHCLSCCAKWFLSMPACWCGTGRHPMDGVSSAGQLLIDQEMLAAGIVRPDLVIGWWVAPTITILAHGIPEQVQRFVPATMFCEFLYCQLFSGSAAGSDLVSLRTKAVRTDGGCLLTGHEVSDVQGVPDEWGMCLARTDPDSPKHKGIILTFLST